MNIQEIEEKLFSLKDEEYRLFQAKLMPGIDPERIIGVRTPLLRALSKELSKEEGIEAFLNDLPHRYYDEYNLHGFIISREKNYEKAVCYVDALLPYVDNWATCDLLSPTVFKKHRGELGKEIERWMTSDRAYTVRFGMEMAMSHYLDEDFDEKWLRMASEIHSEEYYVRMMAAWYFATALAKQWDAAIPYIENNRLDIWTHNKAIQKAVESYRITESQKDYLRTLRRKEK
ncbi:MAG: DNA alkylation repair protein [Clostridia bacterium]|nr:DNA alkylation repair protein [Clostridia bacterium]